MEESSSENLHIRRASPAAKFPRAQMVKNVFEKACKKIFIIYAFS